ncbi:tyrosine-type recombinase/integrase [Corynebacterium sp. YSMAA1_1_F7]|uniref:tyrosine-type recombinase/integrase n=1 Tax=Corynebacterium sp. YSMAA1_1_F7 TaxID=3383590 RepID=UPI0038D13D23
MTRAPLEVGTYGNIATWQRPNGSWIAHARYRDTDHKTRKVEAWGKTKTEAKRRLRVKLNKRPSPNALTTTAAVLQAWSETLPARSTARAQSIHNYQRAAANHITPRIGHYPMHALTPGLIETTLNAVFDEAPGVYGNAYTAMQDFCRYALRHDYLTRDLMAGMTRRKAEPKGARALTVEELADLRAQVRTWQEGARRRQPLLDVTDFLLSTGARIGEALALQWPDIDLEAATAAIHATQVHVTGKGISYQPVTKGNKSLIVPLTPTAVTMLNRRRETATSEWVFDSAKGTMISRSNIDRAWRSARGEKFAWVSFKTFRQSVATAAARANGEDTAAALLGHSSSVVTRAHYIERRPELVPDITAVLEALTVAKPGV